MIKLGNTDIEKVYLGANEINKAYLGNQVIFDKTAVNPFLDATVAYSLRDLGLGATHVVRVRRDSDNAEQDFTATEITDGSLLSFVGSDSGFVSIWYDQKAFKNATKNNASQQPNLVTNGNMVLQNGKPAIQGGDGKYLETSDVNIGNEFSLFSVMTPVTENDIIINQINFSQDKRSWFLRLKDKDGLPVSRFYGSRTEAIPNTTELNDINIPFNQQALYTLIKRTSDAELFINDNTDGATSVNIFDSFAQPLYVFEDGGNRGIVKLQDVIIYDKTVSNQQNIEANLNNHYAIY